MGAAKDATARCYWVTGLAGAGKTTIALGFYDRLKQSGRPAIFLDGDMLRDILGDLSPSHKAQDRLRLALMYGRLCRLLTSQNIDVVCATISMFDEVYRWNRENIPGYIEIYIKTPLDILIGRDKNKIYSRALAGEICNVVGIDIPLVEPPRPDAIVANNGSQTIDAIVASLCIRFILSPDSMTAP